MSIKENVYEEIFHTEQDAQAQSEEGKQQVNQDNCPNGSAVLGKFKDVDALAKAYECLQAEFTRRSQRLKELERLTEGALKENEGSSGVEKLRKNSRKKREERETFEQFVEEMERLSKTLKEDEKENETESVAACSEAEEAAVRSVEESEKQGVELSVTGENDAQSSLSLYEQAVKDENVRLKIIGEYLRSIERSIPPLTVGGRSAVTPPLKPDSIQGAGQMALRYFKNAVAK